MQRALVSIHDVMPSTLDRVERLIEAASQRQIDHVTLLVVPGLDWSADELDRLRRWVDQGCELAGHGWIHRAARIRGWRHRLHSIVISRDVAEHLALDASGCRRLMQRCAAWFDEQGFEIPRLYVPPAWALGPMDHGVLRQLPFALVETQTGVIDAAAGTLRRLPLLGFEATSVVSRCALRGFNALNLISARLFDGPLRISLHPDDLELPLANDLLRNLERELQAISYRELESCQDRESAGSGCQNEMPATAGGRASNAVESNPIIR